MFVPVYHGNTTSADVRAASQSLIEPLMAHVGPSEMLRVMGKAKVRNNSFK